MFCFEKSHLVHYTYFLHYHKYTWPLFDAHTLIGQNFLRTVGTAHTKTHRGGGGVTTTTTASLKNLKNAKKQHPIPNPTPTPTTCGSYTKLSSYARKIKSVPSSTTTITAKAALSHRYKVARYHSRVSYIPRKQGLWVSQRRRY